MKRPSKKMVYVTKCVVGLGIFAWGFNVMLVTLNKPRDIATATTVQTVQPIKDIKKVTQPVKVVTPVVKASTTKDTSTPSKATIANTATYTATATKYVAKANSAASKISTLVDTAPSVEPMIITIKAPPVVVPKPLPTVYINNSRYSVTYNASTSSIQFSVNGVKDAEVLSNSLVNDQLYMGKGNHIDINSKPGDTAYTRIYIQPKGENTSYVYTADLIIK